MFKPIEIVRGTLTIMGVKFSDLITLENTANAIGSSFLQKQTW
jgi:putative transcriptional regulator